MIRLLIASAREGTIEAAGAAHHYLSHVRRVREGEAVEIFDGRGHAFAARVSAVGPSRVTLVLEPPRPAPQVRPVTVLQGMPKADKLELVVQKASELWATAVRPVYCERSVVKPSSGGAQKQARWQKIADEAARQCGRSEVLRVEPALPLEPALEATRGQLVVLDEAEAERTLSQAVRALGQNAPIALVVGPEGGLTPAELRVLKARGAVSATLGQLVLRTETAALAALSVVRHLDGLLG